MNEFVHAPGPKRGAHSVCQSHASVDIADKLWCALASVCSLFQQDDLGLLQAKMQVIHVSASGSPAFSRLHCTTALWLRSKVSLPSPSLASCWLLWAVADTSRLINRKLKWQPVSALARDKLAPLFRWTKDDGQSPCWPSLFCAPIGFCEVYREKEEGSLAVGLVCM